MNLLTRVNRNINYILLQFLAVGISKSYSQVFPVKATLQVIPPYSLKLSEYSTATVSRSQRILRHLKSGFF